MIPVTNINRRLISLHSRLLRISRFGRRQRQVWETAACSLRRLQEFADRSRACWQSPDRPL